MTKKNVFILSITGNIILIFLFYVQSGNLCYSAVWCNKLWSFITLLGESLFVFIPFFLFSLITYKMREEVFQTWWKFTYWFVPFIIITTFLLYWNGVSGGAGMSGIGSGIGEAFILVLLYTLFILTSIIKIILASRRTKK